MASTGAVVHARATLASETSVSRTAGVVLYAPVRFVGGVFLPRIDDTLNRAAAFDLPSSRVPIGWVDVNGKRQPVYIEVQAWFKFFQNLWENRLGGLGGKAISDVAAGIDQAAASVSQQAATTAAVVAQTQANAESLAAAREVIQNAALPGADQIPIPVTGIEP